MNGPIGFIGLGRMGRPMASNLAAAGYELVVHDISPDAVRTLEERGARAAAGPAAVARECEIVLTMLPSGSEVETVVLPPDGVFENGSEGLLLVDMSTVAPQTTDRLAVASEERGMSVVDAPVGRLATHADRGECLFMVGGSNEDVERARPLLDVMGSTTHHCGAVGTGIRTKLVNNYLAIVSCQLNAEALALSQALGLELTKTLEVIWGTSALNGQLRLNWTEKVLRGDIAPGFTIDLAHKDLSLIVDAANQSRVPLPVAAAAREMLSVARAGDYALADFSGLVDSLCELSGIEKPRLPEDWLPPA